MAALHTKLPSSYGFRRVAELQVVCLAVRRVCIYTVSSYTTLVEMQTYWAAESLAAVCHMLAVCYRLDAVPDAHDIVSAVMGSAPAFALGKLPNALHPCKTRSCNATLRLRLFVQTEAELVVEEKRCGISIEWR